MGLSHLAESERAFSEDNVHLPSPDSMIAVHVPHRDSVSESGVPAVSSVEEALADLNNMAASLPPAPPVASSAVIEIVLNDEDGEEGAVVYQETEADTSCVLDVEEDGEEEPEEGEGRSHRETDIWGGAQERGQGGGGGALSPRDRHLRRSPRKRAGSGEAAHTARPASEQLHTEAQWGQRLAKFVLSRLRWESSSNTAYM